MTEPTRVCRVCRERKPWSDFHKSGWRDVPRTECAACRAITDAEYRRREDVLARDAARKRKARRAVRSPGPEFVDIGPWREWVRSELARIELEHGDRAIGVLVDRLGLPSKGGTGVRRVYSWLNLNQWIDLRSVDRALCHAGSPEVLNELYPVDEQVAA